MNNIKNIFFIFCLSLFLAACGSGSADSNKQEVDVQDQKDKDSNKEQEGKQEDDKNKISGRVIDGYIQEATVFIDKNGNRKWDNKEPKTLTDEYGRFELDNIYNEVMNQMKYPIIAFGGVDKDTKEEFKQTLSLSIYGLDLFQPLFITPLSTVIEIIGRDVSPGGDSEDIVEASKNGFIMGQSTEQILKIFGLKKEDLQKNPIAKNIIDSKDLKLYRVNQQIQKSIELNKESYKKFAAKLEVGKSLLEVETNEKVKKMIEFYQNISDEDLQNKRIGIAILVQENIDNNDFNITQEDIEKLPEDEAQEDVDDFEPTAIKPGDIIIEGKLKYSYNQNAMVFLDINGNMVWDEGEKRVKTDENGKYKIGLSNDEKSSMRNVLVAVNGKDSDGNKEKYKSILMTSIRGENPFNITPATTFYASAGLVASGTIPGIKMANSLLTMMGFTKAVESYLGTTSDKFGDDYLKYSSSKLYKNSMAVNNLAKAMALSVKNNKSYDENFIFYYMLLASNISAAEDGVVAQNSNDILNEFKNNNKINEERFEILQEIANEYNNASFHENTQAKVDKLLEKIKKIKELQEDKEAQDIEYEGLPKDKFSKYQWHLKDQGAIVNTNGISTVGGNDLGVDELYKKGIFGKGVHVRVVDDGLYAQHEDLEANFKLSSSYNSQTKTKDPTPTLKSDTHGTQVSGLIAADGRNGKGLRGVAPYATLSAFKIRTSDGGGLLLSEEDLREAWLGGDDDISVVNNSWGSSVIDREKIQDDILEIGATTKRGGKGRIYLIAAGNSGLNQGEENYMSDDAGTSYARTSQYSIVVGSVRNENIVTQYSSQGSNVLVSSYGGGVYHKTAALMATTAVPGSSKTTWKEDTKQQYTFGFNGTSAATPIASGALALVLEKCPNLSYRDIKWLIAHTAKKIDENYDGKTKAVPNVPPYQTAPKLDKDNGYGYITNSAGLSHSNYYGYGLINPAEMIKRCENGFNHLPEKRTMKFKQETTSLQHLNEATATLKEIVLAEKDKINPANQFNKIEWVGLTIYAEVDNLPKLSIVLISPSGTVSRVLTHSSTALTQNGQFESGYRLSSVAFIDENPYGEWKILVHTDDPQEAGSINKIELEIVGNQRNW